MTPAKTQAIKKEIAKDSDEELENLAIKMEIDSQAVYEKLLAECDDETERKIYKEIIADEVDHEKKMKRIKSKE